MTCADDYTYFYITTALLFYGHKSNSTTMQAKLKPENFLVHCNEAQWELKMKFQQAS